MEKSIDEIVQERTLQLQKLQDGMVCVLSNLIENRSNGTVGKVEHSTTYLKILIEAMVARGVYAEELCKLNLDMLYSSACLYDVGKIVIPTAILNKPGKLTSDEFEIMKTHVFQSIRIIDQIASHAGNDIDFLINAKLFAGYHHERWDGMGYPYKLDRLNIPIHGRIMAVVDVYDALISERPYKQPFTSEEAAKIVMDSAGEMFDPLIIEVFHDIEDRFKTVKR
jgi:putative two-component system response regulator